MAVILFWKAGSANGTTSYAFETARGRDGGQELVITDGLVAAQAKFHAPRE